MDPKVEERLVQLEAKIEDNNVILHKLYRVQRNAMIFRAVYWVFIILLSVGAFYFVQPLLDQFKGVYDFGGSADANTFRDLINQYKGTTTDS